ncbi:hypothetical protein [[Phormidium] sp. LEGE 05292]|nr:hypothetical protein [Phormidium sp. LEGE 05292]
MSSRIRRLTAKEVEHLLYRDLNKYAEMVRYVVTLRTLRIVFSF